MLKRHNGHEKRQFGRRQTCVNAWIKVRGRAPIPCHVLNISEGGALVEPREKVALPFRFLLNFDGTKSDLPCEIRHERNGQVGVEFVVARADMPSEAPNILNFTTWKNSAADGVRRPFKGA